MKFNLSEYKKIKNIKRTRVTSVSISEEQHKFLESQGVNISKVFREFLDALILDEKNKGIKKCE